MPPRIVPPDQIPVPAVARALLQAHDWKQSDMINNRWYKPDAHDAYLYTWEQAVAIEYAEAIAAIKR